MEFPQKWSAIWPEHASQVAKEQAIALLYEQLKKDFDRAVVELPFSAQDPVERWVELLADTLKKTGNHQRSQLIYLIDLPETLTRQLAGAEDYFTALAEALLYREFVKVHFRQQYSR